MEKKKGKAISRHSGRGDGEARTRRLTGFSMSFSNSIIYLTGCDQGFIQGISWTRLAQRSQGGESHMPNYGVILLSMD